jgi:YidC/Oxa1 family membrane protein insertase
LRDHTVRLFDSTARDTPVNLYEFPPIAAALDAAYGVVAGLSELFTPLVGDAGPVWAIIAITLMVRTVLIPVGASHVRAELTRRRLAPQLRELQRRHKAKPEVLQQKTMELYAAEKASPIAGVVPALAQAPVLSTVYGLFILTSVNGHVNALLTAHLFTIPLGTSLVQLLASGSVAAVWPGVAVFGSLLLAMAVVAWLARRVALRQAAVVSAPAGSTDAAAAIQRRVAGVLSWTPFLTIVIAGFVPLAAALYLAVTTTWTLVERALLRKRFHRLHVAASRAI